MRTDVKLGVVISLLVVVVAGGYYAFRDGDAETLLVSDDAPTKATGAARTNPVTPRPRPNARAQRTPGRRADGRRPKNTAAPSRPARSADAQTHTGRRQDNARQTSATQNGAKQNSAGLAKGSARGQGSQTPTSASTAPGNRRRGAVNAHGAQGRQVNRGAAHGAANHSGPAVANSAEPAPRPVGQPPTTGGARQGPTPKTAVTGDATSDATKSGAAPRGAKQTPAARTADSTHRAAGTTPRQPVAPSNTAATPKTGTRARGKPASSVASGPIETHVVQPGDSMASLAKMYYGHEKFTGYLTRYNSHIADPARIAVGMRIKIPPLPGDAGRSSLQATRNTRDARKNGQPGTVKKAGLNDSNARRGSKVRNGSNPRGATGQRSYTVKSGDTFYGIARNVLKDSSRWNELYELNKKLVGGDPTKLQVGQIIQLPAS